jgi:hypothetical protein
VESAALRHLHCRVVRAIAHHAVMLDREPWPTPGIARSGDHAVRTEGGGRTGGGSLPATGRFPEN